MKAALFEEYGGPLQWKDLPTPKPLAREVLVRVKAAPVILGDLKIRRGWVPAWDPLRPLPRALGVEVGGVVEAVGPGVTRFKVGDRVFGRVLDPRSGTGASHVERTPSLDERPDMIARMGSVAEFCLCAQSELFPIPESLSFAEAAGQVIGMFLAWHGLHTRLQLKKDEDVFLLPATGAIAFAAAQIARLLGRRVIASTSTDAKVEKLKQLLKPDLALNYMTADLEKTVMEFTNGKGVEVVWDGQGRATFDRTWRTLAQGGRYYVYAGNAPGDFELTFQIGQLMNRRLMLIPGGYKDDLHSVTVKSYEQELIPRFARRELGVPIEHEFPLTLEGIVAAYNVMEKRDYIGRIVLVSDSN